MATYTLAEDTSISVYGDYRYGMFNPTVTEAPKHGYLVQSPPSQGGTGGGGYHYDYIPYRDYNGPDSFVIQHSNGVTTFNMTVTAVPDAPDAVDDSLTVAAYRVPVADLLKNDKDVDGEAITVTSVQDAQNGSVEHRDGFVTYTPADPAYRGDAQFKYTVTDPTGRTDTASVTLKYGGAPAGSATVAIAGQTSLAEGQSGSTPFNFTITRQGDLSGVSDVNWFVWHETTNQADLSSTSGAVRFAAGESSKQIQVHVNGDTATEGDEVFHVSLYDASGATVGANDARGVILNDEGAPPPPPPTGEGREITSPGPGSTLQGGAGADTLNASQGPDVLTGGGGGDAFVFKALPWNAGRVTDFAVGSDRLDLSAIFQANGYAGSDPMADGRVRFDSDGAGGTKVYFDRDAPNSGDWPFLVTTLENVSPTGLTWAQVSGGGTSQPPPPPPPEGQGRVIDSPGPGSTLQGGAGADTLNASQGPDQLTGGGGADRFVFAEPPWNAGVITDFTPGADKIDVSALLDAYAGSNPIADGWLRLDNDGGSTKVYVDVDGAGGQWPFLITTLQGVAPGSVGVGDFIV